MIFVANTMGQMGNRTILFAHCLATALETGQSLVFLCGADLLGTFAVPPARIDGIRVRCFRFGCHDAFYFVLGWLKQLRLFDAWGKSWRNSRRATIPARIEGFRRHPDRFHFLGTYLFRNPRALERHRDEAASCLRPRTEHVRRPAEFLKSIRREFTTVLGVHMRRGDYKRFRKGRWHYSDEQYARFMADFAKATPHSVAFVLISDEPVEERSFPGLVARAGYPGPCGFFRMTPSTFHEDLCLLSLCDFVAGPPSTFSWTAALSGRCRYLQLVRADQPCIPSRFALVGESALDNANAFSGPNAAPASDLT